MTAGWNEVIPRLVHDAKALLRKPHQKAQLLDRRIAANADPEAKALLDAVIGGHLELVRLFTRVGVLADAMENGTHCAVPLNAVVLGVKVASKRALADGGARWECSALPECMVPSTLENALQELVDNSLRFHAPVRPPEISMQCEVENQTLRLEYRDNGTGWDPAYTGRLFTPFERLDAERSGLGLGLAIAKAIVDGAGGTIRAATSAQGSQFVIELPLASP